MPETTATHSGTPSAAGPAARDRPGRRLRLPGRGPGGGSPLFRNAYALMLNTGISAVLGLGFWLAAARYYTESAVGQGSAAIAAMKLIAGLAALTLMGALARFIPVAGETTGRLIFRTYAGSSLFVAIAAAVFLLSLDLWGPSYSFLHGTVNGLGFVLAVVAWSLLTLQDGVLTGLRSALWVPVGNTVFSAVKLVLLVALATAIPTVGVFVSWVAAIAVSVLPLGWLVFRRLVPRHVRATREHADPPTLRQLGRFLAGDYTGSLFSLAVVYAVPVIVAAQVSSADNAYFYIATTIGGTVNLLAINMGASLTVEGSHAPEELAANCRAALRRMARIMLPVGAVLFFGAPYILSAFGQGYADAATPLLRWFAVGALLRVIIETYFAVLRAQSRTSPLAYLQGALCVLVLGLTLLLLPRMGLTGAGVAEVTSLAVIASIAAVKLYGVTRSAPKSRKGPAVAPDGDLADLGLSGKDGTGGTTGRAGKALRWRPRWALRSVLDSDTLPLGLATGLDHPERRPDVRPGPGTPPYGVSVYRTLDAPPTSDAPSSPVPQPSREESSPPPGEPVAGPGPTPLRERPVPRGTRRTYGIVLLLGVALALFWVPVAGLGEADLDRMGGLGLVSVLPAATLLGAGGLVAAFVVLLWSGRQHRVLLAAVLVATLVSLHALPAVIEAEPRFATAWQHLGFLEYIERTGTAVPDLDARWSWPGFFAVAAFVAQACGLPDPSGLLRWWPVVLQLLYLAPMALLARTLRASWRARWSGLWIFVLGGWVGQDYFSPQGFTYLFHLAFVAILLTWFRPLPAPGSRLRPGERRTAPATRRQRAVLLSVLVALFAATVPAHQLTPFVMLGVLTALVLLGRCTLRGLPLLFGVLLALWVGFFAEPYWSGHFDELFGGIGGFGGNLTASVAGRIEGGSSAHRIVLYARVLLAASVLGLACLGWWRRRRRGLSERSLPAVAFVPFLAFGMQSYGGEMALRVFLFALPGAALLAGLALFPDDGRAATGGRAVPGAGGARRLLAPAATLLAGLVLLGGFLVARWGNEAFERVRPGEVTAMEYVYGYADPSVHLLWLSDDTEHDITPALPWGERDMEKVEYVPTLAPVDPTRVSGLVAALKEAGPRALLMVNEGQSVYLRLDSGYSPTWSGRLLARLDAHPELLKVHGNPDAAVYALKQRPEGPAARPDPGPAGPGVTWTPWSVAGGLAALVAVALLAARELVRVAARPRARARQWLPPAFWFTLPLLAAVLAVLVQRFLTMA